MCDSVQDLMAFSQVIYDEVQNCLRENDGNVPKDAGVYVDNNMQVSVVSMTEVANSDRFFLVSALVREEDGELIPDCDNIHDIAGSFFFVR